MPLYAQHPALRLRQLAADIGLLVWIVGWVLAARAAHEAVLVRLTNNQRVAEAYGWTSCALERAGGTGPLRAWGVPPAEGLRQPIPDWPSAGNLSRGCITG